MRILKKITLNKTKVGDIDWLMTRLIKVHKKIIKDANVFVFRKKQRNL
jgi:hypothetical protein